MGDGHAVLVKERLYVQAEQRGQLLPQHGAGATLQRETTTVVIVVKNLDVGHGCGCGVEVNSFLMLPFQTALNLRSFKLGWK